MKKSKYRCSDCELWKAQEEWHSTHLPNFAVIVEGVCTNTGKVRLNCHYQCRNDFKLNTTIGRFYVHKCK